MISNRMIQLAASAHQNEIHRAAASAKHSTDRYSDGAEPASQRVQRVVARMLHTGSARRAQTGPVIPRVSI